MKLFEDSAVAFSHKTDRELINTYWLFKLISAAGLVKLGAFMANIAFKIHFPVDGLIRSVFFAHFCGGETLEECQSTISELSKDNIGSILDYSVEAKESLKAFDNTKNEIIKTIYFARDNRAIPFCVFKTTGIGESRILINKSKGILSDIDDIEAWDQLRSRFEAICRTAFECKVKIFIDAEESWIQPAIDELAEEMMIKYNGAEAIVFNTIQLYRKDRLAYLMTAFYKAISLRYFLGIKLVRGAYMEKEAERALRLGYENPLHTSKEATDYDYNAALKFCINHMDVISFCAGTHNEASSRLLAVLMDNKQVNTNDTHVWFAQLLGMGNNISYNLAKYGYNVAKYVPYGPVREVMPYLIRRAQENTSVRGQTGRELMLIKQELKRRKKL